MNLLMSGEKIVKSVREEVIMIRVHKTSQKESTGTASQTLGILALAQNRLLDV